MKISALIPYKPDFGRRDILWSITQKRYADLMPYIEVSIGLDDNEPFCRAKAVNEAASNATGEIFIIIDADVVFNFDLVFKIIRNIDIYPWIVPFRNGYRLTQKATDQLISEGLSKSIRINPDDYEFIQLGPGPLMNVMKRSCFEKIGGLDERFSGYGYEDLAMVLALDTLCGPHFTMEDNIFHLWHEPVNANMISCNNLDLWKQYIVASSNEVAMKNLINGWRFPQLRKFKNIHR